MMEHIPNQLTGLHERTDALRERATRDFENDQADCQRAMDRAVTAAIPLAFALALLGWHLVAWANRSEFGARVLAILD